MNEMLMHSLKYINTKLKQKSTNVLLNEALGIKKTSLNAGRR